MIRGFLESFRDLGIVPANLDLRSHGTIYHPDNTIAFVVHSAILPTKFRDILAPSGSLLT